MALNNAEYLHHRKNYFAVVAWEQFLGFRVKEYLDEYTKITASGILNNEIVFDDATREAHESTECVLKYLYDMQVCIDQRLEGGDNSQTIFAFLQAWDENHDELNDLIQRIKNISIHTRIVFNTEKFTREEWYTTLSNLETEMLADADIMDIYHD